MSTVMHNLASDVESFVLSVQPSPQDYNDRRALIEQVQKLCSTNWDRGAITLELFGSSRTGLLLPGSDIDVVILDGYSNSPANKSLELLSRKLQRSNMFRSVFFIRAAKVPIIKIQSKSSLMIDISCNVKDGIDGSNFIANMMTKFPSFKPVFLVVKSLLAWYDLNDASSGGLGSFALSVMLLSYLKFHGKQGDDLGTLLLGFLDYFVYKFDSDKFAIDFHSTTGITIRSSQFVKADVVINNPILRTLNASAACRKWDGARALFAAALIALNDKIQQDGFQQFDSKLLMKHQKGDFTPFPFLSVLCNLQRSSVPARVLATVTKKVADVKKEDRKVITIDDDDEESYDAISHKDTKKRKRGNNDDEEDEEEEKKKVHLSPSSSITTTTTTTSSNNNNNSNNTSNNNDDDIDLNEPPVSPPQSQITEPTKIPTFTPINKPPINNTNDESESESEEESEESEESEDESDNGESDVEDNKNEKGTTTTTTTTASNNNNNNNNNSKNKNNNNNNTPPVRTGFIAPLTEDILKMTNQVLLPFTKNPPLDCRLCSICEKEFPDFENHLLSSSHVKIARSYGIFC